MAIVAAVSINAQEAHFKNTTKYLAQTKASGRTTWNMNDTVQLISIDQFNEKGNKTEAYEFYYGKRFLRKNGDKGWADMHDTTHYSFVYDLHGRQIKQINNDFPNKSTDSYHMYRYDKFGNIERWLTGRSYQLPHIEYCTYDEYGSILTESNCWTDSCESESKKYKVWTTELMHNLKYNSQQMVTEDLVNYVDAMMGYQYEYIFDKNGNLINKKKYRVWSYFGLDHQVPTSKDIDRKELDIEWKYEYIKGYLVKETRIDHWMETDYQTVFTYNHLGLIIESLINDLDLIRYSYNEQGLVQEEKHYYQSNGEEKLHTSLKYEYAYRY